MKDWNYIGWSFDSDTFEIEGIDIWQQDWQRADGEVAYGQDFSFVVYQIEHAGIWIKFAAGEFSNNVWGFYVPSQ
jgi:hypothetical protein